MVKIVVVVVAVLFCDLRAFTHGLRSDVLYCSRASQNILTKGRSALEGWPKQFEDKDECHAECAQSCASLGFSLTTDSGNASTALCYNNEAPAEFNVAEDKGGECVCGIWNLKNPKRPKFERCSPMVGGTPNEDGEECEACSDYQVFTMENDKEISVAACVPASSSGTLKKQPLTGRCVTDVEGKEGGFRNCLCGSPLEFSDGTPRVDYDLKKTITGFLTEGMMSKHQHMDFVRNIAENHESVAPLTNPWDKELQKMKVMVALREREELAKRLWILENLTGKIEEYRNEVKNRLMSELASSVAVAE